MGVIYINGRRTGIRVEIDRRVVFVCIVIPSLFDRTNNITPRRNI